MDFLNPGNVVSVRHYSGVNPFKSVVVDVTGDYLKLKLTKELSIVNFLEGDPAVIGIEQENDDPAKINIQVIGCTITNIFKKEGIIEVYLDQLEEEANQRRHERFPVSIYADVRIKMDRKKHLAIIKDISYYGMLILSKSEFSVGDELDFDIYMENSMAFLKCEVIRKVADPVYNKYGLRVIYEDINSMNFVKEYLRRLKEAQENSMRNINEG